MATTTKKPSRRSALAADPLDMLTNRAPTIHPARSERAKEGRMTVKISPDLLTEAKDAVVYLSGPPLRLTLARFVESALRAELDRLRTAHVKGKRFPHHDAPLRAGRPIGS